MDMKFDSIMVNKFRRAKRIAALTGAGISKESGIPTFREAQTGLWAQYDPTELATPQAFERNPQLVWEWYQWRRGLVRQARPNSAHIALRHVIEKHGNFDLITQNVDGLHQRAGNQNVIELHGNIMRTKCSYEDIVVEEWEDDGSKPPKCPYCGHYLRPDVVWFGEGLPVDAMDRAVEAAQSAEVFFLIGTSGVVEPAASLPVLAKQSGAIVIEVNMEETPLTPMVDYHLRGPAGKVMTALVGIVRSKG